MKFLARIFFGTMVAGLVIFSPAVVRADGTITHLQDFLRARGFLFSSSTGVFDSATHAALAHFQKTQGISPAKGTWGPKTKAAIVRLEQQDAMAKIAAQLNALLAQVHALQAQLASSTVPASTTTTASVADAPISSQSIVGLNCYFKNNTTGEIFNYAKGSGVIVSPSGLILTVRHLVDLHYVERVSPGIVDPYLLATSSFDHCEVGQVPASSVLPSPELIRTWNPSIQVPVLGYTAALTYIPNDARESPDEADHMDFALLKINGITQEGAVFGISSLPSQFPYAQLLTGRTLHEGDNVVTYGYPGDVTTGMKQPFSTLFLTGSVGTVKALFYGDSLFPNTPIFINTNMEVRGGRSGSPVLWHGYVAGIVSAYAQNNVSDSYSVSSNAIAQMIAGYL